MEARPGRCDYDDELRLHYEVRRAYGVQPGEHVLDIGCGSGQSTREAARMAQEADEAVGVADISADRLFQVADLEVKRSTASSELLPTTAGMPSRRSSSTRGLAGLVRNQSSGLFVLVRFR